jgi:hypothetical protein
LSVQQLPERVASHFNGKGEPDGWMNRGQHVLSTLAFGSGLIFFLVIVSIVPFILPDNLLSLPNRQYWLAPERRDETRRYIFRQLLWMASLTVCFLIGFNFSIVQANKRAPVQLYVWPFITTNAFYFVGLFVWILIFSRHFKRID